MTGTIDRIGKKKSVRQMRIPLHFWSSRDTLKKHTPLNTDSLERKIRLTAKFFSHTAPDKELHKIDLGPRN